MPYVNQLIIIFKNLHETETTAFNNNCLISFVFSFVLLFSPTKLFWMNLKRYAYLFKKSPVHISRLAQLHMFVWKTFVSPRWDNGKIKWDPTYAGWLTSHTHTLNFLKELLKEGEISPSWASLPTWARSLPYEQSLTFSLVITASLSSYNNIVLIFSLLKTVFFLLFFVLVYIKWLIVNIGQL